MKLRPFELALVVVFSGLAFLALFVLVISPDINLGGEEEVFEVGPVEIWGTIDEDKMSPILRDLRDEYEESFRAVSYQYIDPDDFDFELVDSLAERRNPDLILIPHEKLVEHQSKIWPITYETYPARDFQNSFIDGAQIFSLSSGIYALPLMVDPLMLYWNTDLLGTFGFLNPPTTWEEIVNSYVPSLAILDFQRRVSRSAVAFGTYDNMRNPFAVLSMLTLQGGSYMVTESTSRGRVDYNVRLTESVNGSGNPLGQALAFSSRFANPSNPLYNWNRALPEDREQFIREDLAMYFGFGSEAKLIEELNPNLSFDIAEVPQSETATVRRTYGRFYGLSLLNATDNPRGATAIMYFLGRANISQKFAEAYGMSPVFRSLVGAGSNDFYGRVIYKSAPIARGWLNPDYEETNEFLKQGLFEINANSSSPENAASDFSRRLTNLYD